MEVFSKHFLVLLKNPRKKRIQKALKKGKKKDTLIKQNPDFRNRNMGIVPF